MMVTDVAVPAPAGYVLQRWRRVTKVATDALWKILWEMTFQMRLFLLSVSWSCVAVPSLDNSLRIYGTGVAMTCTSTSLCGTFLQNPLLQSLVLFSLTLLIPSIHLHSTCTVEVGGDIRHLIHFNLHLKVLEFAYSLLRDKIHLWMCIDKLHLV